QGAEVTGCLVVMANRVLAPDVPVIRLLRFFGGRRSSRRPECDPPDTVELAVVDLVARDQPVERLEHAPWERVGTFDRARLAEKREHGLEVRSAEPRHGASENTTKVVWTQSRARRILASQSREG